MVFSEYNENEEAMVRSDRFKLIVGTGRRERKDHLESGRPLSGPVQRLFDLERDPDETLDVSGDAAATLSGMTCYTECTAPGFHVDWPRADPPRPLRAGNHPLVPQPAG